MWVNSALEVQPGNETLLSDLVKNYKNFIETYFTPQSVITDTLFYKEIAYAISMFCMKNTRIKKLGGRGYIGLGFKKEA